MPKTIFEKIVEGSIPCYKIYEDEHVLAFLDIAPANKGHALVISKLPYPDIFDIPDNVLSAVAVVSKKVAIAVKQVTKAEGINILQNNRPAAGQEVFHYHVHVIPRFDNDGQKMSWKPTSYSEGEAQQLADSIKASL